nr:hypothetical protein [uncultured bacterium]
MSVLSDSARRYACLVLTRGGFNPGVAVTYPYHSLAQRAVNDDCFVGFNRKCPLSLRPLYHDTVALGAHISLIPQKHNKAGRKENDKKINKSEHYEYDSISAVLYNP